jgi:periplasmic divalent cation tolerance protein
MKKYIVLLCTTNSFEEAKKIAKALLEKKLAACVNIVPKIFSTYRWKEEIEEAEEALLFIKTKYEIYEKVQEEILKNHSYTIVEVLALDVLKGNKPYLNWLDENLIDF